MQQAGALGPDACDKATRLICLCDAFGLPLVFLHDTPGFMVGTGVEQHSRLLYKATMLLHRLSYWLRSPNCQWWSASRTGWRTTLCAG